MQFRRAAIVALLVLGSTIKATIGGGNCVDVWRAFAAKNIGEVDLVPAMPINTRQLQVCSNAKPTCCTRRMEQKYKEAANMDLLQVLESKMSSLKSHFMQFALEFESDVTKMITKSRNDTSLMLRTAFPDVTHRSAIDDVVSSFYDNVIIAKDDETRRDVISDVRSAIPRFFARLFVLSVMNQTSIHFTHEQANCVANLASATSYYGDLPMNLANDVAKSLNETSVYLTALQAGVEAVSVSGRSLITNECKKSLLKMQYCPHCYGLTLIKPCQGLCKNVMRGCLVGLSEMDLFWKHYVAGLTMLGRNITDGDYDIQSTFNQLPSLASLLKLDKNLLRSVKATCNIESSRKKRSLDGKLPISGDVTGSRRHSRRHRRRQRRNRNTNLGRDDSARRQILPPHAILKGGTSLPLKVGKKHGRAEETLEGAVKIDNIVAPRNKKIHFKSKIRRFVGFLNLSLDYFFDLPDEICNSRTSQFSASKRASYCWDGNDMARRYTLPVMERGLEGMHQNPEMKVSGVHPHVQRLVEKLRLSSKMLILQAGNSHIPRALLVPPYFIQQPDYTGTKQLSSAPCDDEDACAEGESGSGDDVTSAKQDVTENSFEVIRTNENGRNRTSTGSSDREIDESSAVTEGVKSPPTLTTTVDSLSEDIRKIMSKPPDEDSVSGDKEEQKTGGNSANTLLKSGLSWRTLFCQFIFVLSLSKFLL